MEVFKSEFIKSSSNYKDCPKDHIPEYAFIGRSNVGKSSLIKLIHNKISNFNNSLKLIQIQRKLKVYSMILD